MKVGFTRSQRKCLHFVPLKGSFIIWCTAEDKISAYLHTHYQRTSLLIFHLRNNAEKENYMTSIFPVTSVCSWSQIHLTATYFACKRTSTKTLDGDCMFHFYRLITYGQISSVINCLRKLRNKLTRQRLSDVCPLPRDRCFQIKTKPIISSSPHPLPSKSCVTGRVLLWYKHDH